MFTLTCQPCFSVLGQSRDVLFVCSHDFIGEFTTSYRELSRGQSQFNVYEVEALLSLPVPPLLHVCHKFLSGLLLLKVLNPKKKGKKKKYINSGTVSSAASSVDL